MIIKSELLRFSPLLAFLAAAACTTIPTGPSIMALPGTGRSFDQFRASDAECRQFALGQSGGTTANQTAVDSGVKSAVVGTAVGALAGAAIGGRDGAGAGAGTGLVVGSLAGAGEISGRDLQRRYDNVYVQCMYAKGERVPVSGRFASDPARISSPPPPNNAVPPPPPRGYPPPPGPSR